MNHVLQKHSRGCGIAVLAMITGRQYDDIACEFPFDLNVTGLYLRRVDEYLVDSGFAVARKHKFYAQFSESGAKLRDDWPCIQFGEIELCEVNVSESSKCYHFVVRDETGSILDPLTMDRRRLCDYHDVLNIAAVTRFKIRQ